MQVNNESGEQISEEAAEEGIQKEDGEAAGETGVRRGES